MQTEELSHELDARYGEGVVVEYLDVFSPEMFELHQDVLRLVASRRVALPVVSIGGKPYFAGGISAPMICDALETLGLRPLDVTQA